MRKMKLDTVINGLEKVQKDVHNHDFSFGKAVSENETIDHEKIEQMQAIMEDINDTIEGKERESAQAEMLELVQLVMKKVGGNVDDAKALLTKTLDADHDESVGDVEDEPVNDEAEGETFMY